ncbi:MAG: lanthionine synthetase C family protein [Actinomycetota bacterium]|nr:lanthionine synthetase C family protein [Actinomycetota bacterium]
MDSEALALRALEWLVSQARPHGDGLVWTGTPTAIEPNLDLYSGTAGVVMALLEAHRHDGDDRWAAAASAGARSLEGLIDHRPYNSSLYSGATGIALALAAVGDELADAGSRTAAYQILGRVRSAFDGERWGDAFELLAGNAGIALGALRLGEVDLAELAVTPYLTTSEPTQHGLTWENRRGQPARRHHISHGTLGVAFALAATAEATGRNDLMHFALAGAADVVARNEAGPEGFLVPHSDPQQQHERIERYSYGWCHGPTGDAQVFRLLGQLTGDSSWASLEERCWHTVLASGLPRRKRPGFWDNNGRCCGTAGVLALACDREVEHSDGLVFADVLVADLAGRATRDDQGVHWRNIEYRDSPPELEPHHGWAMGNAGIARELLRHARLSAGRDPTYAVDWPDHPPVLRS